MRVWGLQSMINDRALGFSRMGKGPSSLFSIHSRLPTITAVAFAVSNISSWIYRETASIFAVEHNALFELSLKCCAHDSLARPGKFVCVCVLGARPPARARSHATEVFPWRSSLFIQIRPRKGLLGFSGERGFAPIKCTLILSPCCSFLSVFFIV
jgi:hypothetical protein